MDEIALMDREVGRDKVVLGCRVGLDNVASLATNIQVVDGGRRGNRGGTRGNAEHVAAVLEGASSLLGINVDGEVSASELHMY